MYVGTVVELKSSFEGKEPGVIGVCVSNYMKSNEFVSSFLFTDGSHVLLKTKEMNEFLHLLGFCNGLSKYEFVNEEKLKFDYESNCFNEVFKENNFQVYQY